MKVRTRMITGVITFIILSVCFCATTLALIYDTLISHEAEISTGKVSINVNGGAPIIAEGEFEFEAGTTAKKTFYLQNNSICAVYYRLYFSDINGALADMIIVTISKGDTALYTGRIRDLTARGDAADDVLQVDERRELTLTLHLPENAESVLAGGELSFTLCADAVQAPKNDDKVFE